MVGRGWVCWAVLAASVAHAEPSGTHAAGSVPGLWAFAEGGGFASSARELNRLVGGLGPWTMLQAGYGADAGPVRLRLSLRFRVAADLVPDDLPGAIINDRPLSVGWTPIDLRLAAADLLDERHTGLRLTPSLGVTIPTWLSSAMEYTSLLAALQLERRFGPVELAWRAEARKPFFPAGDPCRDIRTGCSFGTNRVDWTLENSLQGEGWITPWLSIGMRLGVLVSWNKLLPAIFDIPAQTVANSRVLTSGHLFFSWAFVRRVGLSLDLTSAQTAFRADGRVRFPFFSFENTSSNRLELSLSVWFRTDELIARNWIER